LAARPPSRRRVAAAIIERHDSHVLIVLPYADSESPRHWQFPRGIVGAEESPEGAIRRIARETLGIGIEIVVGQPPFFAELDGEEMEWRYFFCGVLAGDPNAGLFAEIRWLQKGQLGKYEFDSPSRPIAAWLVEP